jgi:hypothetical protein
VTTAPASALGPAASKLMWTCLDLRVDPHRRGVASPADHGQMPSDTAYGRGEVLSDVYVSTNLGL